MTPQQSELARILAMPRCEGPTPEEAEALQREWVRPDAYAEGVRLLDGQVYGLWSWQKVQALDGGGLLAGLGVGQGKTLLSLLIATEWHRRNPDQNSMLLIPPAVHRQIWVRDIPWSQARFRIDLPIVSMGGKSRNLRRALAQAKGGRCFLVPYSLLSTRDTAELLRWIDPDLVIADEAHGLKGKSAKSKRYWDWLERQRGEKGPPVGVALSGTLTARSPLDYYRVMRWTLGERCTLPRLAGVVEKWAQGLESNPRAEDDTVPQRVVRVMRGLARWAGVECSGRWRQGHLRRAYAERLRTTPGFIPPMSGGVGSALLLENRPAVGGPNEELASYLRGVEDDWVDPDGDVLMYGLEKYERMRELSAGIYLRRYWPDRPGGRAAREAWEAKQTWLRGLRAWLRARRRPPEGLDTPGLVHSALEEAQKVGEQVTRDPDLRVQLDQAHADLEALEMYRDDWPELIEAKERRDKLLRRYQAESQVIQAQERRLLAREVPGDIREAWQDWQDTLGLVPEGAPDRATEVVRVDPYKVNAAVEWAKGKSGSVIWYHHEAVGDWLEEALRERELRVLRKGAGASWLRDDGSERYHCVASISAHGIGKNLQHHSDQFVLQWSRSGVEMEQLLGRVHRVGQAADVVSVRTCATTGWDLEQVQACYGDTEYDQATLGGSRKLLVADWDPPIFL